MSREDLIRAAGCLLWRASARTSDGLEIGLVHRQQHQDWSLPKGKLGPGEAWPVAAVREVAEETGLDVVLGPPLPTQRYLVEGEPKVVRYWAAQAPDAPFVANEEVDALEWLPPSVAGARLSYRHDTGVLDGFASLRERSGGADPDLLVVLRHTRAVKRTDWDGPDEARPLDPSGLADADTLVPVLRAYGPTAIHSSDTARTLRTVEPYARATGRRVTPEPDLSERAHHRKPVLAAKRTHALLEAGGRVLLCSHRPVLPAILTAAVGHKESVRLIGSGLAPGCMVVIHHVRGQVLAVERHDL